MDSEVGRFSSFQVLNDFPMMHRLLLIPTLVVFATSVCAETVRHSFTSPVDDLHGWKVIMGEAGFGNGGLGTDKVKDDPHATLLVRSPRFRLDEEAKVTLKLKSGSGGAIPTSSRALSEKTTRKGPLGVALRRVTDDAWLMSGRLNQDGPEQEIFFSETKLKELHEAAPDEVYTIDFFDGSHGGWGHVQLTEIRMDVNWVEALPKAIDC